MGTQKFSYLLASVILAILISPAANAGIMEISYTYSSRNSFINDDNFQKSFSHTGSFAWYFIEMSALELSYTKGESEVSGKAPGDTAAVKYTTQFEMYDASLILTFAGRESRFQPYIKGGAAIIDRKIYRDDATFSGTKISESDKDTPVPSWGVGLKLFITKNINIKASYDTWKAGEKGSDERWDDAIRAGLSFLF